MSGFFGGGGGSGSATPNAVFQPWGGFISANALAGLSVNNKIQLSGFYLPVATKFSNITVNIATIDAGANYDIGIYNSSGALQAHVGAQSLPGANIQSFVLTVASVTLQPGQYFFAFTGANTTAMLGKPGSAAFVLSTVLGLTESATSSSGGALPSTITIPATAWTQNSSVHAFVLN